MTFKKISELVDRVAELEAALEPFATFSRAFEAKPMRSTDDVIYGIHAGTEWYGEIRHSHCKHAAEVLAKGKIT